MNVFDATGLANRKLENTQMFHHIFSSFPNDYLCWNNVDANNFMLIINATLCVC